MNDLFLLHDASWKRYNTLGLEAVAKNLYLPFSQEALKEAIMLTKDKKRVILGNGSNILLAKESYDDTYAFIVSSNTDKLSIEDDLMVAEAGVSLQRLAWFCIEQGIDGYEFAEDIPGTIGGALISNAGQFEYTIGMYVAWIDVYLPRTESFERITPDADFFGYRRSGLEELDAIVLACGLRVYSITNGNATVNNRATIPTPDPSSNGRPKTGSPIMYGNCSKKRACGDIGSATRKCPPNIRASS
jgi:UDP-N-acetylmuramate dehydrogenase